MQSLGVTAMQGYAFARPMPETELPTFMENWVAPESAGVAQGARALKTIQN
jgi:predicted signal transduction protein with EAL and GGDEF domain